MLVSGVRHRRNTYACRPTDECTRPSEELAELKAAETQRSVTSLRGAFLTFTHDRPSTCERNCRASAVGRAHLLVPHFFRQGCQAATGCESSMSQPEPPHADPLGPFPVVKGQQPLGHTSQMSLVRTTRISTAWPRTRTPRSTCARRSERDHLPWQRLLSGSFLSTSIASLR